jgi:hypothetical protein
VHDLDVLGVPELREGVVETAFAQVAPRTNQIGPDIYAHDFSPLTPNLRKPSCSS